MIRSCICHVSQQGKEAKGHGVRPSQPGRAKRRLLFMCYAPQDVALCAFAGSRDQRNTCDVQRMAKGQFGKAIGAKNAGKNALGR